MKISQIVDILEATIITGNEYADREIFKCGSSDLMSDILAGESEDSVLITGLTTIQVIKTATIAGAQAVVFVRNKVPDKEIVNYAKKIKIPLITTPYSMFVSSGRLYANGMTGLDGKI